jgi:hypothetical protein
MPRTAEEILDQADELANRFETHEPDPNDVHDAAALRNVRRAFLARAETERHVADAVAAARVEGTPGPPSAPWSAHPAKPLANATAKPLPSADPRPAAPLR